MVDGLEVVIQYRGKKYNQVASPPSSSAEFAILKKDLAHLRVHSPSQKNVRRVKGSFILHWPTAGISQRGDGLTDSLHTRWFKLCSDDPEALKLREFLSIESITLTQDGALICSTAGTGQASQSAPPGTLSDRIRDPPPHQPAAVPVQTAPTKLQIPPPPRRPPSAPRSERQQPPHLKRRLSGMDSSSSPTPTQPKPDAPEAPSTNPPRPVNNQVQPTHVSDTPKADRQPGPSAPAEAATAPPQLAQEDDTPPTHPHTSPALVLTSEAQTVPRSPTREPGEMTPQKLPHTPGPTTLGPRPNSAHASPPRPDTSSPYPKPSSSDNRDVDRLTRELWDTRRQMTALRAREQVILNDLGRLGTRPSSSGEDRVSRDELLQLETELRAEKERRVRAERALSDVERECRAPFVVPALFQAFMNISELSN